MITKFEVFNESLYKSEYQTEVKCPNCGSKNADF